MKDGFESSIAEFGFVNPILMGDDSLIIAEHSRLSAAQRLGLKEVPAIILTPHCSS
ncbi:MAG: ParB N-terminal domain-containing protein [Alphaproteobacteria bacterium]|nr:ParB N-terminal domain-containing protein [Alphaproteobacteria bacterium]